MKKWLEVDCTERVKGKKPEDVYNILADLESWSQWSGLIQDTRWKGKPGWREGAKFGFKAGKNGIGLWMIVSVLAHSKNQEIGWGVTVPGLLHVFHNFTFEKDGKDTLVRTTEYFEGPLGMIFSFLAGKAVKKGDAEWLKDLCVKAEIG